MKIWLDMTLERRLIYDECDDTDEECFPPGNQKLVRNNPVYLSLPLAQGDVQYLYTLTLEQVTPLFVQECARDRWLVCNPTGLGYVAVLDREAKSLLERFHSPTSLNKVITAVSTVMPQTIETAVAILFRSGLLQNSASLPIVNASEESGFLSVWLHVTNDCNLRCHYCYVEKSSEHMTGDTPLRAVDAVFRSAVKHHCKYLKLKYAGGEASLHMMNVTTIHDYATQLALRHNIALRGSILSNGVALSQATIDRLKARNISVMISLDGIEQYHDSQRPLIGGQGSFKYVDRTISRLLASGLVPRINVTISQLNLDGLPDLLSYILERGLPFRLSYYRDNDCVIQKRDLQFGEQQMIAAMRIAFKVIEHHLPERPLLNALIDKATLQDPHERTCGVGHSYFVIDQHGGVAKCHAAIKQTLTTIDADDPLQTVRDDREGVQGLSVDEKEGCRTCNWRYWCTGGCPLLTYKMTGRYDIKSPNCNIYQALFPDALRLEGLRLLKYVTPVNC